MKIRDGQVANRPIYVALAVTVEGHRDILGLWAGDGGEGAKYWLHVLTELKNRGVARRAACSSATGSRACPTRSTTVWPQTIVQTCVVHLLRNSFRYAARQDWDKIAKALKPVYTAPTEDAATERFARVRRDLGQEVSGDRAAVGERLGRVRAVPARSTPRSARSSAPPTRSSRVNARIRKAVRARGHFPNEQAALKCVYMALMSLDPTGKGRSTLDHALEDRTERLRDHLRRPPVRRPQVAPTTRVTPFV